MNDDYFFKNHTEYFHVLFLVVLGAFVIVSMNFISEKTDDYVKNLNNKNSVTISENIKS